MIPGVLVTAAVLLTTARRSEAFAPLCDSRPARAATATATATRTAISASPFDWINDVFGDKTKKREEEKAEAEAVARQKEEERAHEQETPL